MIRENIAEFLEDKNFVMLLTTMLYVAGLLSFFYDKGIYCAAIVTILSLIAIFKKLLNLRFVILLVAMFYLGYINAFIQIKPTDNILPLAPNKTDIEGKIISIPNEASSGKLRFFVKTTKVGDADVTGKILVSIPFNKNMNFKIGDNYKFSGKLSVPFRATNPSQFDYSKYLMNFGVYTVLYADENYKKSDVQQDIKWKFLKRLDNTRHKIMAEHSKYIKSPNREIVGGVVFGDDAVTPSEEIKFSFVHSGLLHILAASGMNVAFIFGFWFFLLFTLLKAPFKFTVISGMGLVILYTLMTGMGASVVRASLMLIFVLAGKLVDRDARSISLLSFVALLMLIYNPAYINSVSFQLSFLATLGLLMTGNVIFEKLKSKSKIVDFLTGSMLVPLVAQIWVAPVQMFYFNTFSLYSIFANIISVPFITVVSCGGFFSSIFAIFSPYTDLIVKVTDITINFVTTILVKISDFFSALPNSLIDTTHPSVFQLIIYYFIVILLTALIKFGSNNSYSKKIFHAITVCTIILVLSLINIPSKNLEITAFDVQNADCLLIKTPKNKYFIIDTGKAPYNNGSSQAKVILLKYLKDRGIKNIEGVVVTHFDNDHSGGTVDILENLNVKTVYLSNFTDRAVTSQKIYETIKKRNINAQIAQNNSLIYEEPNLKIKNFKANVQGKNVDNINSTITLLTYNKFNMLFMGDGTVESYFKIKPYLPENIAILKVGHHGANGVVNAQMIENLHNKVSIISTGTNKFGHPTAGTLDILRNTDIYRTDKFNAIRIIAKPSNYEVLGFNSYLKRFVILKKYQI